MRFIARFLSVLFFPLFMPIYGSFLLFSLTIFSYYPSTYIRNAYITVFIFGTAIPVVCIFILKQLNVISDVILTRRRDRFIPYLCTAISYFTGAVALGRLAMPKFVLMLMIAVAVALLINSIVNIWWKISAHLTGVGGLLGGILYISYQFHINPQGWIIAVMLVCGVVAAARLYLNAHTPGQVVAGLLNGILCAVIIPGINFGC